MQAASLRYLEKNVIYPPWIKQPPASNLSAIIVIPAYHETELLLTLESLLAVDSFEGSVEVIVVLNDAVTASFEVVDFHKRQLEELKKWEVINASKNEAISFYFIHASELPKKKAGVGLARKIGMDEAFVRWNSLEKSGPIVCLDADTLVGKNYLHSIIDFFQLHPKCPGISIAYEHPLEGLSAAEREAIVLYELHLRYFLEAKKWAGFPFAFETIGSAMAVQSEEYARQGGMNTRKAGEDFYFLNKFAVLPHFANLAATKVLPSARISERVPFGTGRAIGDMLKEGKKWLTYSPSSIELLRDFFSRVDQYFENVAGWEKMKLDHLLRLYLTKVQFTESLKELKQNTNSIDSFKHRFYKKFDAFQIMKMLHFFEAEGMERVEVATAANWLLGNLEIIEAPNLNLENLLKQYRFLQS